MGKKLILKRSDRQSVQVFITIWTAACTLFALIPLYITAINSLKDHTQVATSIFAFPGAGAFDIMKSNYALGWNTIYRSFFNSIYVGLLGAFVDCLIGAVLGYIFTYKEFHFKETIFMTFIAVMLLPSIMGMPILVPFMKTKLGLDNTFFGYLLPNFAGGQVGGLFLFRTFFAQQPKSIYESAQIEGANDFHLFTRFTLPLALPIILYKFVGTFSSLYNDFLWPSLIMTNPDKKLIMQMIHSETPKLVKTPGAMYAMYMLSSIPLIFTSIISMKFFASGDFAAGIKL